MNKAQAIAFITALNAAQPYVPPIVFAALINSVVCNTVLAVANGVIELQPVPRADAPAEEPAKQP